MNLKDFSFWSKLGEFWCRLAHEDIMWPAHGMYECRVCLRRYPVAWQNQAAAAARQEAPQGGLAVEHGWLASGAR